MSADALADAILQSVDGAYPDDEQVIAAELDSGALDTVLATIGRARDDVNAEIRGLSRESAPDVDGWIAQAKQLKADVEESKTAAAAIVRDAEVGKALQARVDDATSKIDLLRKELDFNNALATTFNQLQSAWDLLASVGDNDALLESLTRLETAQRVVGELDGFDNTQFAAILQRRASQVRGLLVTKALGCWNTMVVADAEARTITISQQADGMALQEVATALAALGELDHAVGRLHRDLDAIVITPRFTVAADGAVAELEVGNGLRVSSRNDAPDTIAIINDAGALLRFLRDQLPDAALRPLLEHAVPSLMLHLISAWLDPAVPVSLSEIDRLHEVVTHVSALAEALDTFDVALPSDADLAEWVERLPQTWLARRREAALVHLRGASYEAVKARLPVEHVETQIVSSDDVMVTDDWNAWGDEEEDEAGHNGAEEAEEAQKEKEASNEDDEDPSAWGFEEPAEDEAAPGDADTTEGDEDAWGWGDGGDDDNGESDKPKPISPKATPKKPKTNGRPTEREITLRENYTVTGIPTTLTTLINNILSDASKLSSAESSLQLLAPASAALASLPTLLLAFYRATAPTIYATDSAGNMLIYNDVQHLLTLLSSLHSHFPPHLAARLTRAFDADARALSATARLAYGRDLHAQRTILGDLLSSTAGFTNCSAPLNAREYGHAVADVVARVRDVDAMWQGVLSTSVRRQAVGQLLGTVLARILDEVLELADGRAGISADESSVLRGFCDQITALQDLFEEEDERGEKRSLVHVYTPGWLRFVYLSEALFAESEMRRTAVREIKRGARA
ncbi:hypothetical protein EJ06DRAFT_32354 [Trichodelitschia bisporula]|uniref:ZW10 C-terminal helical domain-containing protein n=1 Tax=Trichodelitschia bisporula TaxID=703511 RepID=A0A6G1IBS9_9PEZI|nr:hypothetical protein EJ06DRAFT_32354 [Trichodelitschia bisporula]